MSMGIRLRRRGRRGQAIIETMLMVPLMLIIFMIVFQAMKVCYYRIKAAEYARLLSFVASRYWNEPARDLMVNRLRRAKRARFPWLGIQTREPFLYSHFDGDVNVIIGRAFFTIPPEPLLRTMSPNFSSESTCVIQALNQRRQGHSFSDNWSGYGRTYAFSIDAWREWERNRGRW